MASSCYAQTGAGLGWICLVLACVWNFEGRAAGAGVDNRLLSSMTFHASFDHGPDADFARGDARIYTAASLSKRWPLTPGLQASNVVVIAPASGRFGSALEFTQTEAPVVCFKAPGNFAYRTNEWSGTISVWLRADLHGGLAMGYCDPLHITPRVWNDGAFFLEFERRPSGTPFRLGIYADLAAWNPTGRRWEEIPPPQKPLVTVPAPSFNEGRWTHVVATFEHFNTRRPDGVARLYLDGVLQGTITAREQTFTWDIDRTLIMPGLGYRGGLDELSFFDRSLSPAEVRRLNELPHGVGGLLPRNGK